MEDKYLRLATFSTFPSDASVFTLNLADAGFQYEGHSNAVTCTLCKMSLSNWENEQQLSLEHLKQSPNCIGANKHIKNNQKTSVFDREYSQKQNLPQDTSIMSSSGSSSGVEGGSIVIENVLKNEQVQSTPISNCFDKPQNKEEKRLLLQRLGISIEKPMYPKYAIQSVRISTFKNWNLTQSPQELAKAGFFYKGPDDLVRCFHCGGGLTEWESGDDPWVEHAHWFPDCTFLRQCKGDEFVRAVQEMATDQQNITENHHLYQNIEDNKEDDDPMKSAAVLSIFEMDYTRDIVSKAVEIWKTRNGAKTFNATDLLDIVFEIEDNTTVEGCILGDSKGQSIEDEQNGELKTTTSQIMESTEISDLMRENRRLRETTLCKICMDESVEVVFLPCGHMCTCVQCAPAMKKCPVCRSVIGATIRAHLS